MRTSILLLALLLPLRAEFLYVKLDVRNMDCATCLKSLEIGMKKTKGVEKVTVPPENGAEFDLKPGNKITLERLRDSIKAVGFTPLDAHVVVRGTPVTTDGRWHFQIEGLDKTYMLNSTNEKALQELRANTAKLITVEANSPLPADPRTTPSLSVTGLATGR